MSLNPANQLVVADLPSARSQEEAAVRKAAMEWSLLAPIIIRGPEDVQSRVRWSADLTPFIHQYENLYTFCRRLPVSLIADDVGLGKTITAGLILSELLTRQRVRRALVLCPRILCHQWEAELRDKFGIDAYASSGKRDFLEAAESTHTVVIATNQSVLEVLPQLAAGHFEMLILDEAHKLRNLYGTRSPPQIAVGIRRALEKRIFAYVLMLTATPLHNRLWDMYSLIDLLALGRNHANPFGPPEEFRSKFIDDSHPGDRKLQKGRTQEFRAIVRDYMVRTRRVDARLPFPHRKVQNVVLPIPGAEATLFEIVGGVLDQLEPLEQASLAKALLSSPQALARQMENMCEARPQFAGVAKKIRAFVDTLTDTAKLRALGNIVDALRQRGGNDWRLLVFTERTETQKAIGEWLTRHGVPVGFIRGGAPNSNARVVRGFQADPPNVNCVVSTDAGSEGLNLQVCSYLVNFDLPWNPMIVEQRIGRIQRLSSQYESVVVQNLVLQHPADAHVVGLLMQKLAAISTAVDDIESVLEDLPQGSAGKAVRFEDTVRELVVAALRRQDVSAAIKVIERNIEIAEAKKKEQEKELDRIFAPDAESAHRDLRPPDLSYPQPGMSASEFVMRAKQLEGSVQEGGDGTWLHTPADGLPEQFCFSREVAEQGVGVFGRRIEHYDAGTPAFQRLVGRWANEHHRVLDMSLASPEQQLEVARRLLADRPYLQVRSVTLVARRASVRAALLVRAQVSNGVDRYEKLLTVGEVPPPSEHPGPMDKSLLRRRELPESVRPDVLQAVQEDPDIRTFLDYYHQKYEAERERADGDAVRLSRLAANYTPRIESKVVAAEGARHAVLDWRIRFAVDGQGDYQSAFSFDTSAGAFVAEPAWYDCPCTGRQVPLEATAECAVTGARACAHAMSQSAVSGARMLPSEAVLCAITGATLLPSEAGASAISGVPCDRRILQTSAMSGRKGIESECVMCAFTNTLVLRDEVICSALSNAPIRADAVTVLPDGRKVHESELRRCEQSGELLPPDALARSDLTGRLVARRLLVASEVPPHRAGTACEMVTCCVTGKRALRDEVLVSAVSGRACLRDLATVSTASGRHGLPEETATCVVTGKTLLVDEVACSALSGQACEKTIAVRSAVSGRSGLPTEATECEVTGVILLTDEIATSDVTGRRFRKDQSAVLSDGRTCHTSETRRCEASGDALALSDGAESAVSGKWVHRSLLVASEKPGSRLAMESETIVCPLTGKRLLLDEVATSATGLTADRDLLTRSDLTGRPAFPDELQRCNRSGVLALPSELEASAVSGVLVDPGLLVASAASGGRALPEEMVPCDITSTLVLPTEIGRSDITGRQCRTDQLVPLADGRRAHQSEARLCGLSSKVIAIADGASSDVSGLWVEASLLVTSDKTGRRGLADEAGVCVVSRKRLLRDELGTSATGAVGDKDLLVASEVTGDPAFPGELVACEKTGRRGLPAEMGASDVSGVRVARDLLVPSQESGRVGLQDEIIECCYTRKLALRDEVAVSDVSGKLFVRSEAVTDDEGHCGHTSEFARCARSGKLIPRVRLRRSHVSGVEVDSGLLVHSEKNPTRSGLAEETVRCVVSGKLLLRDEAATSDATGRLGDKDLMLESPRLHKKVFPDELVTCSYSHIRLLPEEMVSSALSGTRAALEAFMPSALSGRLGLPSEMGLCEFTHVRCLKDELRKSDISGQMYRVDESAQHEDGRCGHRLEFRVCIHSGRCLLPDQGSPSAISGRWVANDHAVFSELPPYRRGLPEELVRCEVTGKMLLTDEVEISSISGRRGDRTALVQSAASKRWGFPDEMVWLADYNGWFLPEEVSKCEISGRVVPLPELGASQLSGRRALHDLLVTCSESGQRVLPEEARQCGITKAWFLPQYVGLCVESGKVVSRKLLTHCDIPQGLVIDDARHRVRSPRNLRVCAMRLAKRCYWSGKVLLPDEGGDCVLLGLRFEAEYLRNDQLVFVSQHIAGSDSGIAEVSTPAVRQWIAESFAATFRAGQRIRRLLTADGRRGLYFVDNHRWPWQPARQLVFLGRFDQRRVFGRAAVFTRHGEAWRYDSNGAGET